MNIHRGVLIAALAMVVSGCGSAPPQEHWFGSVSTLEPQLCVARHDAAGDCFVAKHALLAGLSKGSCVELTADRTGAGQRLLLTSIKAADARDHLEDCP
jgi:hypothetical protein